MPITPEAQPATRRDLRLAGAELRRNAEADPDGGVSTAPNQTGSPSEAVLVLSGDEPIVIDLRDRVDLREQLQSRNAAARDDRHQREMAMAARADLLRADLLRADLLRAALDLDRRPAEGPTATR